MRLKQTAVTCRRTEFSRFDLWLRMLAKLSLCSSFARFGASLPSEIGAMSRNSHCFALTTSKTRRQSTMPPQNFGIQMAATNTPPSPRRFIIAVECLAFAWNRRCKLAKNASIAAQSSPFAGRNSTPRSKNKSRSSLRTLLPRVTSSPATKRRRRRFEISCAPVQPHNCALRFLYILPLFYQTRV